ncbi:hypothetical protein Tco_1424638 [Tanacetum coccineum]
MFNDFTNMALPPRNEIHEWLRLAEIEDRDLDMSERMRMQHKGADGEVLFTTSVWRDLLEQSLQTLTVEVRELPTIDLEELIRLRICERLLDIVAWAPQMPQAATSAPRTLAQRLQRVEEEEHRPSQGLREKRQMLERIMSE